MNKVHKNIGERGLAYPPLTEYYCMLTSLIDGVDQIAKLINAPREQVTLIYRSTGAKYLRRLVEERGPIVNFPSRGSHGQPLPCNQREHNPRATTLQSTNNIAHDAATTA
jgi:hypothetical protein